MTYDVKSPQIVVCAGPAEASQRVAQIIADTIRAHPECVLGLATGGTPVRVYRELVRIHREEGSERNRVDGDRRRQSGCDSRGD